MAAPLIAAAARGAAGGAGGGFAGGKLAGGLEGLLGGGGGSSALGQLNGDISETAKSSSQFGSVLGQLNGVISKLTSTSFAFAGVLGPLSPVISQLSGGVSYLTEAMESAFATSRRLTEQYVRMFAPAEANLFQQAVKDLNATLGEQLVPVTRAARDVIRWFADGLATVTPYVRAFIEEVIGTLKPTVLVLGETFRQLFTAMRPTAQLIGELFIVVLESVTDSIITLVQWFNRLLREVNAFFGLQVAEMGDSRGKAYAPANTTNAQGLLTKLQQNAFGQGREDPARKQISILGQIERAILDLPDKIADAIRRKATDFKNDVNRKADKAADFVVGGIGNVLGQRAVDILARIPRFDGL